MLFFQGNEMEIEEKKEEEKESAGKDEDFGDGMTSCPICTFINPVSNVNCEVCESPLQ
jgi:hypothetical protein